MIISDSYTKSYESQIYNAVGEQIPHLIAPAYIANPFLNHYLFI